MRGGMKPRGRGGANRGREPLRFDGDFDFESSNAQFDKDNIEKELKKLSISEGRSAENFSTQIQAIGRCGMYGLTIIWAIQKSLFLHLSANYVQILKIELSYPLCPQKLILKPLYG